MELIRAQGFDQLWLPALGVPARKYARLAEALRDLGVSVAVHEWRGNGSSSLRPHRRQDWGYRELLQQDLPVSLSRLRARLPEADWSVGGHSLGGQLAAMLAAREPQGVRSLILAGTGVPDARSYRGPWRWGIRAFALSVPILTGMFGVFPGDRLRWAGREAATLMREWAGTVRRGNYRALDIEGDIESDMACLSIPALGLSFAEDRLVPAVTLDLLLTRLGPGVRRHDLLDRAQLGVPADHFLWMKSPGPVAARIAAWMQGGR